MKLLVGGGGGRATKGVFRCACVSECYLDACALLTVSNARLHVYVYVCAGSTPGRGF